MPTESGAGSERIPLYILAGGRSRRFGSDKARATLDGDPLITRLARELAPVASSTTVVAAAAGAYDDLGLTTIADDVPGLGPAGGIVTALRHRLRVSGNGWLVVSACDWAGVEVGWVRLLLGGVVAGAGAVLFDTAQPLFCLYHTRVEAVLGAAVDSGSLRMQELVAGLSVATVPAPPGFARAVNVNRPGDLDTPR
jgi:molybdopterin-guanine dinucleotide biosynthesis protein A